MTTKSSREHLANKLGSPSVYLAKCGDGPRFYCDPDEPLTPGCRVVVRSGRRNTFGILIDLPRGEAKGVLVLHNRTNSARVVCREYPQPTVVRAIAVATLAGDFPLAD